MQPDERSLVTRVAHGDAHALRQLYTAYRPRLWGYLWQQLDGDEPAVEDALQDVFLAVWRAAGGFRGESRINTWIFRIAHHHVLHRRRDIARRPEGHLALPCDDAEEEWGGAGDARRVSHEDEVVDRLTLAAAFGRLSPKHREALELVYQHGFALEEVAQILDAPVGTIKSRISYARRALRRELADASEGEEHRS